jgi:hypothetical protein
VFITELASRIFGPGFPLEKMRSRERKLMMTCHSVAIQSSLASQILRRRWRRRMTFD